MRIPMQSLCCAHCRTTGAPCKNYKMANGRCRMHGGKGSGRPKTHGMYTKKAVASRKQLAELNRDMRDLIKQMEL